MSQLIDNSGIEEDDDREHESNMIHDLEENPAISIISKSSTFSNHPADCTTSCEDEVKPDESTEGTTGFNWNQLSTNLSNKNNANSKENEEQPEHRGDNNIESAGLAELPRHPPTDTEQQSDSTVLRYIVDRCLRDGDDR